MKYKILVFSILSLSTVYYIVFGLNSKS